MSYLRRKSRTINTNVYIENRLLNFVRPPVKNSDLYYHYNSTLPLQTYSIIPTGTMIQSASINEPDGWLLCDGRALLKSLYSNLFGVIGHTYGGVYGDSDLSFNIPDLRGRIPVGAGTGSGLSTRNLGSVGGEESHMLTVNEMPSHSHTSNAVGGTIGLITSNEENTASSGLDRTIGEPNLFNSIPALSINSTGNSAAHNNMQPFVVINYFIKY